MNNELNHADSPAMLSQAVAENVAGADITPLSLRIGRRALAWALIYLMIPLGVADVFAQEAPPPPPADYPDQTQPAPQAYMPVNPEQLNQMVAPIALYPDSLVAQILAASTFPNEIADADAFVQSNRGVPPEQLGQMVDGMNWDPSVKALIAFPTVLANLNRNMSWTTQLGNAYYNQPQDVMSAIQVMRQRAYEAGNLRSTQQLAVTYEPDNIVIVPANPTVVYVPYYDPWVVYGTPVIAWGGYYPPPPPPGYAFVAGLAIGFGVGIAIASWNHWGWGWHGWGCGWGNHTIVYNRNVYISRSVTVINHGYYGGYDRNIAARNYNHTIAVRAPNYRPGYNGTYPNSPVYRNSFNKTVTNNFNHTVYANNVNRTNNNYNRVSVTNYNNHPGTTNNIYSRPATSNATYSRPGTTNISSRPTNAVPNSYTRPANNTGYNRPTATSNIYNSPGNPNGYNRPAYANNTYNRPTTNNVYSRPAQPNINYSRPAPFENYSRPAAPSNYSRPPVNNTYSSRPPSMNSYHPASGNNFHMAPQGHPASGNNFHMAPQSHPAPESHPSNQGHPGGGGGGHPHGR